MYTDTDFRTKKALREAIAAGEQITYYQPGPFGGLGSAGLTQDGTITLEGPHYPKPHRWYARARVADGLVVEVLK